MRSRRCPEQAVSVSISATIKIVPRSVRANRCQGHDRECHKHVTSVHVWYREFGAIHLLWLSASISCNSVDGWSSSQNLVAIGPSDLSQANARSVGTRSCRPPPSR